MYVATKQVLVLETEEALTVIKALDSPIRTLILSLLTHEATSIATLTASLGMPLSTVNFNVRHLQEAGLISVVYEPGTRGTQKLLSKRYDEIVLRLPGVSVLDTTPSSVTLSMPVGAYRAVEAHPSCGLASDHDFIGLHDDPRSFSEPEHAFAQLLWFRSGFVEYAFPRNLPFGTAVTALEFSAELCSEAVNYNLDWPSDITVWIGGTEIGTWTSPADFGGTRGALTPAWWPHDQTMYGLLTTWTVTDEGTFLNGERCSDVTIADLDLDAHHHIPVRLGVKEDARHRGGLNVFGRRCGNHPQDLLLRLTHAPTETVAAPRNGSRRGRRRTP